MNHFEEIYKKSQLTEVYHHTPSELFRLYEKNYYEDDTGAPVKSPIGHGILGALAGAINSLVKYAPGCTDPRVLAAAAILGSTKALLSLKKRDPTFYEVCKDNFGIDMEEKDREQERFRAGLEKIMGKKSDDV